MLNIQKKASFLATYPPLYTQHLQHYKSIATIFYNGIVLKLLALMLFKQSFKFQEFVCIFIYENETIGRNLLRIPINVL